MSAMTDLGTCDRSKEHACTHSPQSSSIKHVILKKYLDERHMQDSFTYFFK